MNDRLGISKRCDLKERISIFQSYLGRFLVRLLLFLVTLHSGIIEMLLKCFLVFMLKQLINSDAYRDVGAIIMQKSEDDYIKYYFIKILYFPYPLKTYFSVST